MMNRTYLLITLMLAFIIPTIEISVSEKIIPLATGTQLFYWTEASTPMNEEMVETIQTSESGQTFDFWLLAIWVYTCLAIGFIVRSIFHLIILQKLKIQSEYVKKQWFRLFKTTQPHPFSFLSNVFISNKIFGTNSFDQILEHECEHVRQYHSLDRLIVDFMSALFWFNPFMYLYRRALIEIHEYQADAAVLKKFPDPIGYQEVLFSQLSSVPYSGLVSHFNFSTIKKRIVMINKQNNRRSVWAYLLVIPVTLLVILAFSGRVMNESIISEDLSIGPKELVVEGENESSKFELESKSSITGDIRTNTSKPIQGDYTPSILPLKETDKMKVTSPFGMRIHPVDKKRKMHFGVDFGVPIGITVIATADGVVGTASSSQWGYGKLIMIEHGDKYRTKYGQLSSIDVKEGDVVKKGQRIGLSGNSGRSTDPHLHYEVIEGVSHKNPVKFIKNYKFKTSELVSPSLPRQTKGQNRNDQPEKEELRVVEQVQRERLERAAIEELAQIEQERVVMEIERAEKMESVNAVVQSLEEGEIPLLQELEEERVQTLTEKERIEMEKAQMMMEAEQLELRSKEERVQKEEKRVKSKSKKKEKVKNKKKVQNSYEGNKFSTFRNENRPFRVLLDASHGGNDTGVVSISGAYEKDISLRIAKKIADNFFGNEKVEIIFTRSDDSKIDLIERLNATKKADLFISIHTDTQADSERNFSSLVFANREFGTSSKYFANLAASEFLKNGRECKVGTSTGHFILKNAFCPALLFNAGYLATAEDEEYLTSLDEQKTIAYHLTSAIKSVAL